MNILLYQVDAFTDHVFGGNPAAVCPLESWLSDREMQAIAAENNLAETAFFVRNGERYDLRWFTPAVEMDLCGHATLASAYVLFQHLGETENRVVFHTRSGELAVEQNGDQLVMNFPSRPPEAVEAPAILREALGNEPQEILASRDYFVVYGSEAEVRTLHPDLEALKHLDRFAVIVTAPGDSCDFVSRFFAPGAGVPEDPVTGSAHCTLIPYWANRLNKHVLHARQVSKRGGELFCELQGDRVEIAGRAVLYMTGTITI